MTARRILGVSDCTIRRFREAGLTAEQCASRTGTKASQWIDVGFRSGFEEGAVAARPVGLALVVEATLESRNARILELRRQGMTRDRIAAKFGLSPSRITNILSEARQA